MFVISEADADAIRAIFDQEGELCQNAGEGGAMVSISRSMLLGGRPYNLLDLRYTRKRR
jgi:hypothetical protein